MTPDHGTGGRPGAELWSLREDVHVQPDPGDDGLVRLQSRWGDITIQRPSLVVREALRRMVLGPISLENVIGGRDLPPGEDPAASLGTLHEVLDQLQPFVIRTLGIESGQPLLSVVPLTPRSRLRLVPLPADMRIRLSIFAKLHTDGNEYRLESPLSLYRVLLHRPEAVWLLSSLSRPITVAASVDAATGTRAWPHLDFLAADVLAYLAAVGMVVAAKDGDSEQDLTEDAKVAGWSAAELAFHTLSNNGRHDDPVGRTYPLGKGGSPEPVVKPRPAERHIPQHQIAQHQIAQHQIAQHQIAQHRIAQHRIALHRPTWESLSAADPSLSVVMEGRRSVRSYGTAPVTAADLGDLLYRTARVRSVITPPGTEADGEADPRLSDRPYPGGGACYELELYVTAGHCQDIPRGIYHYDPLGHSLELVNADHRVADVLLRYAADAAAMDMLPPVLITMTARFRRLSWKYEGIAYATVLKDVGVLLQNLYLVCTAMGLAPCALGAVNLDLTARAFGTDWRLEPSVGQFILGRAPDRPPEHGWDADPVNDAQWADQARELLRGG